MREGELLALTPADIDFEKSTVSINKSYQRLGKEDVISTPKTEKSRRTVTIPSVLSDCLREYICKCYGLQPTDRLFPYTKSFLYREMEYGRKAAASSASEYTIFVTATQACLWKWAVPRCS